LAGSSLWIEAHNVPSPVIYYPALPIINDRQDFTAMIAPVSRSRAA
jgi:hypothetical protein